MKKRLFAILTLFILCLAIGYPAGDKADLLRWLKHQNADTTTVTVWSDHDFTQEKTLTAEELTAFFAALQGLKKGALTENKHSAGITPDYGFHLVFDNKDYYLNQADGPHGQFEISYQNKQWWIESSALQKLLPGIPQ